MGEDRAKEAIMQGFVLEGSHGPGSASDLLESPFDGIGGSDLLLLGNWGVQTVCNSESSSPPRTDR